MSTATQDQNLTKVITGKVRLSYCNIWTATSVEEGGEKKYSTAILIPKADKATLDKINKAIDHLKEEAKKKFGGTSGKLPKNFKLPLRDGDEEKDDDAYEGMFFLNASSKKQPGIVGLEKDEDGKLKKIEDEGQVYSGCFARVSINFYIFDVKGNKGIAAGLNNVQKVADGPALSGANNADADFDEEFEDEDNFLD